MKNILIPALVFVAIAGCFDEIKIRGSASFPGDQRSDRATPRQSMTTIALNNWPECHGAYCRMALGGEYYSGSARPGGMYSQGSFPLGGIGNAFLSSMHETSGTG